MNLFNSLFTIFAIIFLGIFCAKRKIVNGTQIEGFEIFLFKLIMPCYLFTVTLNSSLRELLNVDYILSYLVTFICVGLVTAISFRKDNASEISIKILASGYANSSIYALPIITFLLGDPIAAALAALLNVLIIQLSMVTVLNVINHNDKSIIKLLVKIVANPLFVMPIAGFLCNYLYLDLYIGILETIKTIGGASSSLALFTFGLGMAEIKITKNSLNKESIIIILIKNILHPIIAFYIGHHIFDLEEYWLWSLIIGTSAPTAFVVYIIAKEFIEDSHSIKKEVALSCIFSLFSLIVITLVLTRFY